jgi:hypothetical protein
MVRAALIHDSKHSYPCEWLRFLESRVVEGRWCFSLRLWGVREAAVGTVRDELTTAALAEIGKYNHECISQPPAEIIKPAQLMLNFQVGPEGGRL